MNDDEISLQELAELSGVEIRTLRSWLAQDLLLPPIRQGRGAAYPRTNLARARAIRVMREIEGMGLTDIRRHLWAMTAAEIEGKASALTERQQRLNSASDYLRGVLEAPAQSAAIRPAQGPALLLARLSAGSRAPASHKARAYDVTVIPVTPEIDIHIRGTLSATDRADFEQIADLIRATITGEIRHEQ